MACLIVDSILQSLSYLRFLCFSMKLSLFECLLLNCEHLFGSTLSKLNVELLLYHCKGKLILLSRSHCQPSCVPRQCLQIVRRPSSFFSVRIQALPNLLAGWARLIIQPHPTSRTNRAIDFQGPPLICLGAPWLTKLYMFSMFHMCLLRLASGCEDSLLS